MGVLSISWNLSPIYYMDNLKDTLQNKKIEQKKNKFGGAQYEWQDQAVEFAKKLNIKLTPDWFRFFKLAYSKNQQGLIHATYSSMADISVNNPKKYFYKVFYNKLNER